MVDVLAVHLLGRHVARRALDDAAGGLVPLRRRAGDPEVEDLHLATARDHDVARVDVSVHETKGRACRIGAGVRVGEAVADFGGDAEAVGPRDRMASCVRVFEDVEDRPTLNEFHRDVVAALELTELIDRHDVAVAQADGDLRLVDEHLHKRWVLGVAGEDPLDDHLFFKA